MGIWAIVPVKPLHHSKSRLAHILSAGERAALVRLFLAHLLTVLKQVPEIAHSLVVSSDPAALAIARHHYALTFVEAEAQGLNVGVNRAVEMATESGAGGVLILPADLPFVQVTDVALMVRPILLAAEQEEDGQNGRCSSLPLMAICPDDKEDGTNALLLYSPAPFTFRYGPGSFNKHLQEASRRARRAHVILTPGLTFDLDTEKDWSLYKNKLHLIEGHH